MLENMSKEIPRYKYTPEEKELEHKHVTNERKIINKMDIPEGQKEIMRDKWLDYIMMYNLAYIKHREGFGSINSNILTN